MRAVRQCETCPFRGADDDYKREAAQIPGKDWPCHTEDLYGEAGIQCRGHWEAQQVATPAPAVEP